MSKHVINAATFAAAAFFSSVSMAGSLTNYPEPVSIGASKTRAQVVQEMLEFRRNPVVGAWQQVDTEAGWIYVGTPGPGKARSEVRRELEAFQQDRAAHLKFYELYGGA